MIRGDEEKAVGGRGRGDAGGGGLRDLALVAAVWRRRGRIGIEHWWRYQAAVARYAARFPVGMSRGEVEAGLRAQGVAFHQSCCDAGEATASDLVEIGLEAHP